MNKNFTTLLIVLACATRSLANSTVGSVSLGSQTPNPVMQGSNATYTVTVTRAGTGNLDVYLSLTNLPAGVSATFAPSMVHFAGSSSTSSSTLTVVTTVAAVPGTYNITVTGRDGGSPNFKTADGVLVIGSNSSNPNGTQSAPRLSIQNVQGLPQITCTGAPGYSYQIQATSDLLNPTWALIGSANADQNGVCVFSDPDASSYTQRFYRALTTN